LKYCPSFPGTFASPEEARAFCGDFFHAYNHHHRHAGLGLLTLEVVHTGQAKTVHAARAVVLDAAHALHSSRAAPLHNVAEPIDCLPGDVRSGGQTSLQAPGVDQPAENRENGTCSQEEGALTRVASSENGESVDQPEDGAREIREAEPPTD